MARWKLTAKHYLNVEGTKYRYEETDKETGKRAEKEFLVPRFLDPEDRNDCNRNGELVVFLKGSEGKPVKDDFIFVGPPTRDMEPLDEEAEKITEQFLASYKDPIGDLPEGMDYGAMVANQFERALEKLMSKGATIPNQSVAGVSREEFEALQKQLAELMAQNAALVEAKPTSGPRRL